MIKTKHTLDYCYGCECFMVICFACGNNCCNSAYGSIGGSPADQHLPVCPECPNAYDVQDAFWDDGTSVEFAGLSDKAKKEQVKQAWRFEKPKVPTRKDVVSMFSFIEKVRAHLSFKKREDNLEWGEESILDEAECILKDAGVLK